MISIERASKSALDYPTTATSQPSGGGGGGWGGVQC